jgi:branched-chain amino acid transport system permease protein
MDSLLVQARREPVWHVNKHIVLLLAALALFLVGLPLLGPGPFYLHLMILVFMYAVMSQSWNVIAGLSGQISLGHGMFFGIGAYASSVLYVHYGVTPWIGIVAGMVICGLVAILIGIPMLRLSGHYFAIAPL